MDTFKIVIVVPEYTDGRGWSVHLTDGDRVMRRRYFQCPDAALRYVRQLIMEGSRPAFLSALSDLLTAATLTPAAVA